MALSGTTLTVTTLTTAGLLTNNTSGQISTVTGSSLGSLLGGNPTFTGVTISGLGSSVLKTTAGVIGNAIAGTDYQYPVSPGTNITITGANTNTINVIASPSFTGLTLSAGGLANTMLKTVSGVITAAVAYTDYTPALTASGNVSIISGAINTVASPTFLRVNCSTLGTNNTLTGTFAGAALLSSGAGGNSLYGYRAGVLITSGTFNTISGYNAGANLTTGSNSTIIGYNAGASLTTGSNSTIIGYNAGDVLATGSNGLYIGNGSTASSSSVSNEGVINVSGSTATGRGADTLFINASAGLYGYSPAYCQLVSTAFNNSVVTWAFYSDGNTTYNKGFTLYSSNTLVVQPFQGLYEVTVSGNALGQATSFAAIELNVNNIKIIYIAYQSSGSINGNIVNVSGSQLSRPYVSGTPTSTGWSVTLAGGRLYSSTFPLFMTIKFISL